jgi:hypothetical protein
MATREELINLSVAQLIERALRSEETSEQLQARVAELQARAASDAPPAAVAPAPIQTTPPLQQCAAPSAPTVVHAGRARDFPCQFSGAKVLVGHRAGAAPGDSAGVVSREQGDGSRQLPDGYAVRRRLAQQLRIELDWAVSARSAKITQSKEEQS